MFRRDGGVSGVCEYVSCLTDMSDLWLEGLDIISVPVLAGNKFDIVFLYPFVSQVAQAPKYYYYTGADSDCALSSSFSFQVSLLLSRPSCDVDTVPRRCWPSKVLFSSLYNITFVSISRLCVRALLCQNMPCYLDRATDVSPVHLPPSVTAARMSLAFKLIGGQ